MSFGSVVFFEHQIVTGPFEKNFHQVSGVRSLSTIRMRRLSFNPQLPIEPGQDKAALVSRGRKSASITLFISLRSRCFLWLSYVVSQVTNQAPRNPMTRPINGLEIANQSGIASRKGSESCLRKRQRAYLSVFVFTIIWLFSGTLTRRPFDFWSSKTVRATQQGVIHKIRTSDNHRWAQPIRDVRRARRRVCVVEVACKSGSHPFPSEERMFSSLKTSA